VKKDPPFVSVIIPAFDEERYLPATLQALDNSAALLFSREGVTIEVVVVDNNSADATARVARSLGACVIAEPENNIARARNRGAESAQGTVLVFLDADTQMPEELLPRIYQVFGDSDCVGGAVDTDYRPRKLSLRVYLSLWRVLGKALGMAQGATQFCRRGTFDALGGYDETLFMGEDVDFYARMRRHARAAGGSVRFIDELRVVPSCRRFDQWVLWRTLIWTNPIMIAPLRRVQSVWRGWYGGRVR
jgi:glycosyltransferase involved in cell wall biosynthesis